MGDEELIRYISDKEETGYINSMNGMELNFDQCGECDSWIVGEHRCSCGNRRVDLEISGNIVDGFSSYPQAY